MGISKDMQRLLGEDQVETSGDMDLKTILPQILLAMQALQIDADDDEQLDGFLKLLKKLAASPQKLRAAIRAFSPSRQTRALKTVKASV